MADQVLSSLLRINRQRMRLFKRALAPYGYVGVMHLILFHIRRNPGASQEEIAGHFSLDKTSVARDARRLEEMGHIRAAAGPGQPAAVPAVPDGGRRGHAAGPGRPAR